ncbi:MAG: MotA/TolQ/ExbB proton channel family protein [Candidatus Zhuqueibacterota bacterium]
MIDYIVRGGLYIMLPLIFLSVVSFALILERLWRFFRIPLGDKADKILNNATESLATGDVEKTVEYCKNNRNILTYVYLKILERFEFLVREKRSINEMRTELGIAAEENSRNYLEEFISIIYTASTVAPLLGLLGTITGMIKSFEAISRSGVGDPTVVSDGIAEALITTAAGLIIAIPSVLAYNILRRVIERRLIQIEPFLTLFINALLRDLARFRTYKEMLLTAYRDGVLNKDEEAFLKEKRIELNISEKEGQKLEQEVKSAIKL